MSVVEQQTVTVHNKIIVLNGHVQCRISIVICIVFLSGTSIVKQCTHGENQDIKLLWPPHKLNIWRFGNICKTQILVGEGGGLL